MQRFVAKNVAAKGKDQQSLSASSGALSSSAISGQTAYLRRTRHLKLIGDKNLPSSSAPNSSATPQNATVLVKNLRNSATLNDNHNKNNNNATINKRNKRSIHERENNTGASKILRRYASTTMAVQQKQKDPINHHSQGQSASLVVKKITVQASGTAATMTSGSLASAALTAAGGSKTYPGPTARTKF